MQLRYPFWTLLALAGALCVVFVSTSMRVNGGELIPPLDDAFIHFQYAKRVAEGAPFSYQEGEGFSSGATSLIWPFILAIGWRIGFTGLSLYTWTLILNTVLLAAVGTFTYRWLGRVAGDRTALLGTLILLTTGPFLWAAFSGMEVVLFATAMAAVLDGVTRPERPPGAPPPGTLTWAAILAAVRPEGAILAGVLAIVQVVDAWLAGGRKVRAAVPALLWFIPVSLGAVQPILNLVNTGIIASSSALAKQNPRFAHPNETVFATFVWDTAFWGGYGARFYDRAGPFILVLFLVGAWVLALRDHARRAPGVGTIALVWWLLPLVLLALLLPIGWHHFRYLIPFIALFAPIVAIGAATVDAGIARLRGAGDTPFVLATVTASVAFMGLVWPNELGRNARDIRSHQVELAQWLAATTPPYTIVAANDVGALAYLSERKILDLEGIVSLKMLPDALEGEGSTYERMLKEDPDVFVVFPEWFDTVFASGVLVPRRYARLVDRSISGGDPMVVATLSDEVAGSSARPPTLGEGERLLDTFNVSDLQEERTRSAWFEGEQPLLGRANRVIAGRYEDGTPVVDSARRLFGAAAWTMDRGAGARLIARFGASEGPSRLLVRVDGTDAGVWDLPAIPDGVWRDLSFTLPGTGPARIEIVPVDVSRPPTGGWHIARVWTVGR